MAMATATPRRVGPNNILYKDPTPAARKTIVALKQLGGTATIAELAKHLGIPYGTVELRLCNAIEYEWIVRVSPGVYRMGVVRGEEGSDHA